MTNNLAARLLPAVLKAKGSAELTVVGVSMQPTLRAGDIVTLAACEAYSPGDIIVFSYKNEGLLIHRLLKAELNRLYLKGDNAFRLEDIAPAEAIGRMILVNKRPLPPWPNWKINFSYQISRLFFKAGYRADAVKTTGLYRLYEEIILKKEDVKMNYRKTEKMDFIESDETSLAAFDPESGTTYFLDETGIDILKCLEPPCDLTELLTRLCKIYNATPERIRPDVEEFLADTVEKGIVEAE